MSNNVRNNKAATLQEFYQDGLDSLSDGTFDLFETSYREISDLKTKRIMSHLKIKWNMFNGKFKEAISKIKKTRFQYGDHIGLVCDLASLYYTTQQYALWNKCVEELECILQTREIILSQDSYVKTMFLLSKFQEEQGCISKSYSTLLKIEPQSTGNLKLRIHAGLLRLDVFYKISNNVSAYYYEIKQALSSDLGYNTGPEIIHALALAEVDILGIVELEKDLLKRTGLDLLSEDSMLILIDVALLLSQKKMEIPSWLVDKMRSFTSDNVFEKKIVEHVLGNSSFMDNWGEWPAQMPLGNFFHLSFFLNDKLTSVQKKSLSKQIMLLTNHLPNADQKYWRNFLAVHEDLRLSITHHQNEKTIQIEDVYIPMKNKKILFEVLVLVLREKKVMLSQVSENVFQSEFNESYYHRIRRLVKRINNEFEAKFLPPPIQCDKNFLFLCKKYQ